MSTQVHGQEILYFTFLPQSILGLLNILKTLLLVQNSSFQYDKTAQEEFKVLLIESVQWDAIVCTVAKELTHSYLFLGFHTGINTLTGRLQPCKYCLTPSV